MEGLGVLGLEGLGFRAPAAPFEGRRPRRHPGSAAAQAGKGTRLLSSSRSSWDEYLASIFFKVLTMG